MEGRVVEVSDYIDWQKSQNQASIGNRNMQYAKSRKVTNGAAELFGDEELAKIEVETGAQKRDQLAFLNRKVKQFEERVARDEVLMRNRGGVVDGGSGSDAIFEAQSQVNDQYIKAIEAKLKILDKL